MKVLIADPDWSFAQRAQNYLESRAHLVVVEKTPGDAIARARHWQPEVVIAAGQIAQEDLLPSLAALHPRPAVLLTEFMHCYARAWRAWQRGGDELLIKPLLNIEELHLAIITALENAATGRRQRPAAASA